MGNVLMDFFIPDFNTTHHVVEGCNLQTAVDTRNWALFEEALNMSIDYGEEGRRRTLPADFHNWHIEKAS
jgi:hypothetical protein